MLSGGTITGNVAGGVCPNTAKDNNIILTKGAAAADLSAATLYGSVKYDKNTNLPTAHSGNTLTVEKEKNITVANVKNFDAYDFQLGDVKNGDTILTVLNDTDLGGAAVTVTSDSNNILSLNKGETVYLLKKAGGELTNLGEIKGLDHIYTNAAKNATIQTTGKVEKKDSNLLLNIDKAAYAFTLDSGTANAYTFIDSKNTNDTTINGTDLTLNNTATTSDILSLNKGDTVYLLKKAGGTLDYTPTGKNDLEHTYTNNIAAGIATIHTTGKVQADGNDLVLKVDAQSYTFDLSNDAKDGNTFLTSTNTGTTKIDGADVKVKADDKKLLSLNKGETVTLLKDGVGTLSYDGTSTFDHKYTNAAGTATVATTGKVKAVNNDLVLDVDTQSYTFDITSATKGNDVYLSSTNTGATKIDAADVTVNDKAVGSILSLNNGDTVYLLKNSANGTLEFNGTKEVGLDHTYKNADKTASIATAATVEQSGNDLVLKVGTVKYFFTLNPSIQGGYTYLTSENAAGTELDGSTIAFEDDTSQMLSLNKGDTVRLLKKTTANTLTYTGTKDLDRTYTSKTDAGTAKVQTTGAVTQDGDALHLNINDVKYTFDLASDVKDGNTFLTSTNTGKTVLTSDDVTLGDSALQGKLLSLSKGDTVYLLKDSTGTLTYTDGTKVPKLEHSYTSKTDAGNATVQTTGSVSAKGNDLVLDVDTQSYKFNLDSEAKDGDAFLTSTNTGATKIDSADVTLKADDSQLLSLNKGESVYLLKNDTAGTLAYTGTNTLNHTYAATTATGGSATVATTGTVRADGNDLKLDIDGVTYTYHLTGLQSSRATVSILEMVHYVMLLTFL